MKKILLNFVLFLSVLMLKAQIPEPNIPVFTLTLKEELEIIYEDDQEPRRKGASALTMMQNDARNLERIEVIFEKHGYPGKTKVGEHLSGVAFLVIQHSNLTAMKKYYTLIEEAANSGELRKSSFALFVDRYRMWSGEKQLYGSQVINSNNTGQMKFYDIEDEPNVNKRRAEMGMGTLEEYAKIYGIDYKLPVKKD